MIPTWIVWSVKPPECREKVACESIFDAACAWAERLFRRGMLVHSGTEVLVCCASDLVAGTLPATTYQVKLAIVNAPAFRASLVGVVNEAVHGETKDGGPRG